MSGTCSYWSFMVGSSFFVWLASLVLCTIDYPRRGIPGSGKIASCERKRTKKLLRADADEVSGFFVIFSVLLPGVVWSGRIHVVPLWIMAAPVAEMREPRK